MQVKRMTEEMGDLSSSCEQVKRVNGELGAWSRMLVQTKKENCNINITKQIDTQNYPPPQPNTPPTYLPSVIPPTRNPQTDNKTPPIKRPPPPPPPTDITLSSTDRLPCLSNATVTEVSAGGRYTVTGFESVTHLPLPNRHHASLHRLPCLSNATMTGESSAGGGGGVQ